MKITVNECEYCNKLFKDDAEYATHIKMHETIERIEEKFDLKVDIKTFIQRDALWLHGLKQAIENAVKEIHNYPDAVVPWSYAWCRYLNDSNSLLDRLTFYVSSTCGICYRQYDQPYYVQKHSCATGATK